VNSGAKGRRFETRSKGRAGRGSPGRQTPGHLEEPGELVSIFRVSFRSVGRAAAEQREARTNRNGRCGDHRRARADEGVQRADPARWSPCDDGSNPNIPLRDRPQKHGQLDTPRRSLKVHRHCPFLFSQIKLTAEIPAEVARRPSQSVRSGYR
jgi:hypothetical protein